jgi:hypothetical protein
MIGGAEQNRGAIYIIFIGRIKIGHFARLRSSLNIFDTQ